MHLPVVARMVRTRPMGSITITPPRTPIPTLNKRVRSRGSGSQQRDCQPLGGAGLSAGRCRSSKDEAASGDDTARAAGKSRRLIPRRVLSEGLEQHQVASDAFVHDIQCPPAIWRDGESWSRVCSKTRDGLDAATGKVVELQFAPSGRLD